jgi:SET domain-containing protein
MPIIEVTGDIFNKNNVPDHSAVLQIGKDMWIGSSGRQDDYLNSSCSPNCYLHIVGKRAILYSKFVILPNNEITIDYNSLEYTANNKKIKCTCGYINCRGTIPSFR